MAEEKNPCSFRDTNSGLSADGLLRHSTYENCLLSPVPIYLQIGTISYCVARMAQCSSTWHQGNSDYYEQNSREIKAKQVSGATWHTGTQRDKNDGRYSILDASRTPEMRSNISDYCCHRTHYNDAHKESCMALPRAVYNKYKNRVICYN